MLQNRGRIRGEMNMDKMGKSAEIKVVTKTSEERRTPLHLRQTQSSLLKMAEKREIDENKVKNCKPRILQRQIAFQHSKDSLSNSSDKDPSDTGSKPMSQRKRGDPDGCDSSRNNVCVITTARPTKDNGINGKRRSDKLERSRIANESDAKRKLLKDKGVLHNSIKDQPKRRQESLTITKPFANSNPNIRKPFDSHPIQQENKGRRNKDSMPPHLQSPLRSDKITTDTNIKQEMTGNCVTSSKSALPISAKHKVVDISRVNPEHTIDTIGSCNTRRNEEVNNNCHDLHDFIAAIESQKDKMIKVKQKDLSSSIKQRVALFNGLNNKTEGPEKVGDKGLTEQKVKEAASSNKSQIVMDTQKEKPSSTKRSVTDIHTDVKKKHDIVSKSKQSVKPEEQLEFIVPLESHVEVADGSELELWVKVKGARKVLWVKNEKVIPNAPPDFIYHSNPIEGIYSLRIKDVFLQDSGVYICEAYGHHPDTDAISWCNVEVIEDLGDDESVQSVQSVVVEPVPVQQPRRKLIVPVIITTSAPPEMDELELSPDICSERRLMYSASSSQGSREFYEDALEDIHEEPDEEAHEKEHETAKPQEKISSNLQNSVETLENLESESLANAVSIPPSDDLPLSTPDNPVVSKEPVDLVQENCKENVRDSRGLKTQSSTESCGSDAISGSSVEGNNSYVGTFRDSLSDNPLAPKFLMGPSNLIVMLGETVNLRVKIWTSDESSTEIGWCKLVRGAYLSVNTLKRDNDSQIVTAKPTNDLVTLKITKASYEDCGKYRVKVHNQHGSDYHHCVVTVEGPPEPPRSPPVAQINKHSGNILISWHCCPFDGGSAIQGYILEMKLKPMSSNESSEPETWLTVTSPKYRSLCYTLKNPKKSFTYYFRVCVENSHGKGKSSKISDGISIPEGENADVAEKSNPVLKMVRRHVSSETEVYEYKDVGLKHKDFSLDYDKHEQLGKGRFGVVFKVTCKETKKPFAGKFVKCRKAADKERSELEYKIMNDLKYHPKLICLVDAYEMPREIVIVTELIAGGELFERVVADDFTLTERDCVAFLRQICDGAQYIHDSNIMHLDLKPENILCTQKNSNQIKIIDFGLAQYYNPDEPIRVLFGTAEFVSPEIINYETICPATDMWSVGVITYILLSGLSPFLGDDDNDTFSNITRGDFDFEDEAFEKVSDDAKDFISSLIVKRKEKRLTAAECLEHKWLALSDAEKKDIVLSTDKLKRFLLRRKWQKTGNAIRALGRITTLYSSSRRSSSGTSLSSVSSPTGLTSTAGTPFSPTQESFDDSVFSSNEGPSSIPSTKSSTPSLENSKRDEYSSRSKYEYECCRSDSGIGGEPLSSGQFSLD